MYVGKIAEVFGFWNGLIAYAKEGEHIT